MRFAGVFSNVVLAFVCASMTFVAFESASIPVANRASQTSTEAIAPPAPALDHWSTAARPLEQEMAPASAPVVITAVPVPVAVAQATDRKSVV